MTVLSELKIWKYSVVDHTMRFTEHCFSVTVPQLQSYHHTKERTNSPFLVLSEHVSFAAQVTDFC